MRPPLRELIDPAEMNESCKYVRISTSLSWPVPERVSSRTWTSTSTAPSFLLSYSLSFKFRIVEADIGSGPFFLVAMARSESSGGAEWTAHRFSPLSRVLQRSGVSHPPVLAVLCGPPFASNRTRFQLSHWIKDFRLPTTTVLGEIGKPLAMEGFITWLNSDRKHREVQLSLDTYLPKVLPQFAKVEQAISSVCEEDGGVHTTLGFPFG